MAKGAVFRASVRGARRAGQQMRFASRGIQREILDEFGQALGPRVLQIHREFAPHRSGALERGLVASVRSRGGFVTIEVISTVRSKQGYPYTDVTRFGHRGVIHPRSRKALAWEVGGREVIVVSSRGYHPSHDWVEDARLPSEAAAVPSAERIGRRIGSRLL